MRLKPFSLAAALLWAMAAQAQVPPPALPGPLLEDPAQRALRERQDTERRREATQPAPQIAVAPSVPDDAAVDAVVEPGTTFDIHRIELTGNTV
ncbi:ShlB/FhaC/HecB family hemolysin secretion/activation protein, partial [Ralstonia pseudosolanacearum]